MTKDLKSRKLIILKAALFVVIGFTGAALLFLRDPSLLNLFLIVVSIWAFCRAYYFAFYVITNYLDPDFKYSGIHSAIRHLFSRRTKGDQGRERNI